MITGIFLQILLILFLIICSGFFSGTETSILNSSKSKIHKLKMDGNKSAIRLHALMNNKEKVIGAILLGNNFVNIAASAIATGLFIELLGDAPETLLVSTIVMTLLILVFAEVLPKTYAVRNSESFALAISGIFTFITKILYPFTKVVEIIVNSLLKLLHKPRNDALGDMSGLDIMRGALEHHHEEGSVVGEDKYMIGGLIDLEKIKVNEVMTHRNDISSLDISTSVTKILSYVSKSKFTRIPVWKNSKDNIIGLLHAKDILNLVHSKKGVITEKDINKLLRKPWFIPDTTDIKSQLLAFKQNQAHLTIVVDEYGELMGLLSLEDIIEEIVGQIDDEYDNASTHQVFKVKDGSININGDISIRDLNREMHWNIEDEDATSIGGLIFNLAKKVPKVGASFESQGFTFRVTKKQKNKISRVNIKKND